MEEKRGRHWPGQSMLYSSSDPIEQTVRKTTRNSSTFCCGRSFEHSTVTGLPFAVTLHLFAFFSKKRFKGSDSREFCGHGFSVCSRYFREIVGHQFDTPALGWSND